MCGACRASFPYSFRDLTPVAALVADPGVFVARADHGPSHWPALLAQLRQNPRSITFGGGSVRGSLDHIVLALALDAAGIDAKQVRYLPYDGGGKAMLALLGGEVDVLSTGLGETVAAIDAGQARPLAVTAAQRVAAIAETPTFTELGFELVFANWRGVFGPPEMSADDISSHVERLRTLRESAAWQAVLQRRGWEPLAADGAAFTTFLEDQEAQLAQTLRKLGFAR